jgi:hypothetical protein
MATKTRQRAGARNSTQRVVALWHYPQRVGALWHYHCPDCCISDQETGCYATADAIYCEVCIETDETHVRLHRWPVET